MDCRVHLVLSATLYNRLVAKSERTGVSMSELIRRAIAATLEKEKAA